MSKSSLRYVAVGGADEIGMNFYFYGHGAPGDIRWIAVDCGINFGDPETVPGVERILPDARFLAEPGHRLEGVFLTHAHEDHVGAMADLWPRIGRPPMFATRFAAEVLRRKFRESPSGDAVPLTEAKPLVPVDCGPFSVAFHPVEHSIPDSHLLAIRSPAGLVVHSGDFRALPRGREERRLRALGDEGVLCLACESTNVFEAGEKITEAEIQASVRGLVAGAEGAVIATTFGSNVRRLETLARAASEAGREVVVSGRAMLRMLDVAEATGLGEDMPPWGEAAPPRLPRSRLFHLVTGSQGEDRAVMSRIARNDYPGIRVERGDLVLFSSSTVPGNERAVHRVQNRLVMLGADVVTRESAGIHLSGHAGRQQLKKLHALLRPKIALPIHGEPRHRVEHARLARLWGAGETVLAANGDVWELGPDGAAPAGRLACGRLFCEGRLLLPEGQGVLRERRRMAASGHASVSIVQDGRGRLLADPAVELHGAPLEDPGWSDSLPDLLFDAVCDALERTPRRGRSGRGAPSEEEVESAVVSAVLQATKRLWGRTPLVSVLVTRVDR